MRTSEAGNHQLDMNGLNQPFHHAKNSETQLDVALVEAQRVLKGSQNGGKVIYGLQSQN
jgi:hypothetical protein